MNLVWFTALIYVGVKNTKPFIRKVYLWISSIGLFREGSKSKKLVVNSLEIDWALFLMLNFFHLVNVFCFR